MRHIALHAQIRREDALYVALCPELDIASQGATEDEAMRNLSEAVQLFLDCADKGEIIERVGSVRSFDVALN
jgi:predicted RNase H-like HicB family nuclease